MLLIVEATKFGAFVVRVAGSGSSIRETMMMGTVGVKMFGGSIYETSSWNGCA